MGGVHGQERSSRNSRYEIMSLAHVAIQRLTLGRSLNWKFNSGSLRTCFCYKDEGS